MVVPPGVWANAGVQSTQASASSAAVRPNRVKSLKAGLFIVIFLISIVGTSESHAGGKNRQRADTRARIAEFGSWLVEANFVGSVQLAAFVQRSRPFVADLLIHGNGRGDFLNGPVCLSLIHHMS